MTGCKLILNRLITALHALVARLQSCLQGFTSLPGPLQGGAKKEHSKGPISGEQPLCTSFVKSLASIQAFASS